MQRKSCTIAAAILSLAFPACDAPEAPAAEFRVLPGGYWTDGDKGCDGIYIKSEAGSICLPLWSDPECDAPQLNECGQPTTKTVVPNGVMCILQCQEDWQCHTGQVCDAGTGMCVWQNMPKEKANAFAPCEESYQCDGDMFCAVRNNDDKSVIGSFCATTCEKCFQADVLYCEARISTMVPACDGSICIAPCQDDSQCLGGSVCIDGACAWPMN